MSIFYERWFGQKKEKTYVYFFLMARVWKNGQEFRIPLGIIDSQGPFFKEFDSKEFVVMCVVQRTNDYDVFVTDLNERHPHMVRLPDRLMFSSGSGLIATVVEHQTGNTYKLIATIEEKEGKFQVKYKALITSEEKS